MCVYIWELAVCGNRHYSCFEHLSYIEEIFHLVNPATPYICQFLLRLRIKHSFVRFKFRREWHVQRNTEQTPFWGDGHVSQEAVSGGLVEAACAWCRPSELWGCPGHSSGGSTCSSLWSFGHCLWFQSSIFELLGTLWTASYGLIHWASAHFS